MSTHDFDVPAGTELMIEVSGVTDGSVARVALFGPGAAFSGTNLLTDQADDYSYSGQDGAETVAVTTGSAGVHRLAIGRDWGSSAGASGNYNLSISGNEPFGELEQTVDDEASEAGGFVCP